MDLVDRIKEVLYQIKQDVKALQSGADTYIVKTSTVTNSSNTTDVTLFTGPTIASGEKWVFEVFGSFTTAATTTGVRLAVNDIGSALLGGVAKATITDANAATEVAKMLSEGSAFILTTAATNTCGFELKFQIHNTGGSSITPTIGVRSEVSSSLVTVNVGTMMNYHEI